MMALCARRAMWPLLVALHAAASVQSHNGYRFAAAHSTLVTAYFDIPSKHSNLEYLSWMSNLLSLRDAMVIFTTHDMAPKIKRLRAHALNLTRVVPISLEETKMATLHGPAFWATQHNLDPEKATHPDPRLYMIWNEKPELIRKVVVKNPFRSRFFAWIDIGYARTSAHNGQAMVRHIPSSLGVDQVLLLDVSKLYGDAARLGSRVGGGFIGGYANGIMRWCAEYYSMLDVHKHEFIGKDQVWMSRTCTERPNLCMLVVPDNKHGSPWFYMIPFLKGDTKTR